MNTADMMLMCPFVVGKGGDDELQLRGRFRIRPEPPEEARAARREAAKAKIRKERKKKKVVVDSSSSEE